MNIVVFSRMIELSEVRTKHERIRRVVGNWKMLCLVIPIAFTLQVIVEQIIMLVR